MKLHGLIAAISAAIILCCTGVAEAAGKCRPVGPDILEDSRQRTDTSCFAALDAKLGEYLKAIQAEPAEIQKQEADFLIEICSDSLIRQRTAVKLYGYYTGSPVMGFDAVAVHLYDKWFATGKVKMPSEAELYAARLFAETNRRSLIGCRAPEMTLYDTDGKQVRIMSEEDTGWRILFFYSTDCAKCRLETIMLKSMLENHDYPVTLYAIYIGTDKEAWSQYISEKLDFSLDKGRVVHLWDPELTADIGFNYGVFQTPRMFLANPQGIITGRGLDTSALEQLLDISLKEHEYGSDRSAELYDKVFAPLLDSMDCSTVSEIGSYVEKVTLEKGDTTLFKQMAGDLLYYITNRREEGFKCGTEAFADRFILSRNDIWNTQDDSLKVVGLASMLKGLASLAPVGSKLPDIDVHGTLRISKAGSRETTPKVRSGIFNLAKMHGRGLTVIIFHTEGCHICKHELAAAEVLLKTEKGLQVLEINMDELYSSYPSEADAMMRHFDLSSLPFILEADSRSRVTRKYLSIR